jgi:hypothetical protein
MKKIDLKKLAMMGISGGLLLTSTVAAEESSNPSEPSLDQGTYLAARCGGGGKCSNKAPAGCSSCGAKTSRSGCSSCGAQSAGAGCGGKTSRAGCSACNSKAEAAACGGNGSGCGSKSYRAGCSSGCGGKAEASACGAHANCGANKPPRGAPYRNVSGCGAQSGSATPSQHGCNGKTSNPTSANTGKQAGGCNSRAGCGNHGKNTKQTAMTETELLPQLSEEGKKDFSSLTPQQKQKALKMASYSCKGQNECKGQNSCANEQHSCAGKGSCQGTTKGPFTDKNQAVKAAGQRMADKRQSTQTK